MRAFIIGHYGGRNFGDELMLDGLLQGLGKRGVTHAYIFCPDALFKRPYPITYPVTPVQSRSIKGVIKTIISSDMVILGGGTIFHDAYPADRHGRYRKILILLASIFVLARFLGKKVYLLGVGVGPLRRPLTKFLTTLVKWSAHGISVRDESSSIDLARLPGEDAKTVVANDLSYLASYICLSNVSVDELVVGISIVPPEVVGDASEGTVNMTYDTIVDTIVEYNRLSSKPVHIQLFCANIGTDSDIGTADKVARRCSKEGLSVTTTVFTGDPGKFAGQLSRCHAIISARYHVCLVADTLKRPLLWLGYQRKVLDAAHQLGQASEGVFAFRKLNEPSERQRLNAAILSLINNPASAPDRYISMNDPLSVVK
jgi:polysaccharide pyruvyl transferase WcaK-like protein